MSLDASNLEGRHFVYWLARKTQIPFSGFREVEDVSANHKQLSSGHLGFPNGPKNTIW